MGDVTYDKVVLMDGAPGNAPATPGAIGIARNSKIYVPSGNQWAEDRTLGGGGGSIPDPLELGAAVFAGTLDPTPLGADPATGFVFGGPDVSEYQWRLTDRMGGSAVMMSLNNETVDLPGLGLFSNQSLGLFENDYPDAFDNLLNLYAARVEFQVKDATAEDPLKANGRIQFGLKYWDGSNEDDNIYIEPDYVDADTPRVRMVFGSGDIFQFIGDRNGNGMTLKSYNLTIDPQNDDTGSLGTPDHTWGDIYATLQTSVGVTGQLYTKAFSDLSAGDLVVVQSP